MRKNNSSLINQIIKSGNESFNVQINSINIGKNSSNQRESEIIIPIEVTDFIFKGKKTIGLI
jgi:hypothetical protein